MKKILIGMAVATALGASAGLTNLRGEYRNGQVFLRWNESDLPADARLSVWSSAVPITAATLKQATEVASLLNVGSARDWWLEKSNFVIERSKKAKSEEIFAGNVADVGAAEGGKSKAKGFVIVDGGRPINPAGGLHVHTPKAGQTGERYFAVACVRDGKVTEFTATEKPIEVGPGKVNAIRIGSMNSSTKGKPMIVYLHGRGGGVGVDGRGNPIGNHIIFADSTLAWREGIPYKFTVAANSSYVQLTLNDRTWIGRSLTSAESKDRRDHVPAIASFWMGYNRNIGVSNLGPEFTWDNYTERLVLHIVRWTAERYGVDANRIYLYGGSMGGTGSVQMAVHYPEVFAAAYAMVPVYAFTWEKTPTIRGLAPSITRMQCSIGQFQKTDKVLMPDGTDILEYCDGARYVARPAVDIPPIFATNGRQDMSIPWVNNPPFFRAANDARQALAVFWNNGPHGMTREVPSVVTFETMFRYRLDQAYPAFSNSTDNRDYGDGDPTKGDLVGWINRGMSWSDVKDTPTRFEMTLKAEFPEQTVKKTVFPAMKYPVSCDVTFRRRRQFRFAPGTKIKVSVNGEAREVVIDKNGLLTVEKVTFAGADPVRIVCTAE